jgi:hypothetical protein
LRKYRAEDGETLKILASHLRRQQRVIEIGVHAIVENVESKRGIGAEIDLHGDGEWGTGR